MTKNRGLTFSFLIPELENVETIEIYTLFLGV